MQGALQALAVSLAVMIGIGPLLAYYFQVVTPVSLIANVPVIPLVGLATALGGGLLVFASTFPPVAALFAVCAKVTINLMVLVLFGFSQIPGGNFFVPEVSLAVVLGYYAGLVLVYVGICVFIRSRGSVWEAWQVGL